MKHIAFSYAHVKPVKTVLLIIFVIAGCSASPLQKSVINSKQNETPVTIFNPDTMSELIQEKIMGFSGKNRFTCQSELNLGISLIPSFYIQRKFSPAWMGRNGEFLLADDLLEEIKNCKKFALKPEYYHFKAIETLLSTLRDNHHIPSLLYQDIAADLDILLTDTFFRFSSHLLFGVVNLETVHIKGESFNPDIDLVSVLNKALKDHTIRKTLQNLSPHHQEYLNLQSALKKYRELAAKNESFRIPAGEKLQYGVSHERVRKLRKRLIFLGDLKATETPNPTFFDHDLEKAVKLFQFRHGLSVDGIAGDQTVAAINIPVQTRLRQIEFNMERWRWLPRDLGTKYILVNIANFKLSVVENNHPIMEMRVVVGKRYRKTPVFSGKMLYLVINPYWNVPTKLAVRDIAPKVCSDPDYLAAKNIKVYKNWQQDSPEIDPALISWCTLTRKSYFPYKLQQTSGQYNPLGKIKFIFPNRYAVYLHDTPEKSLFDKTLRYFSSGCIRVEKPYLLAEYLLKSNPHWTKEAFLDLLESSARKNIFLNEQIPIYITYITAWEDSNGVVHFRNDVYKQDRILYNALKKRPCQFWKLIVDDETSFSNDLVVF
ncbi:MAG: L,D-transpeptidase family protein [Deltaproteobacteria bacterium]|jgi:murein L,D-transpeptidase YcbB/YkuD|nr:L,D-transpeptidase family protein [Deltaproteobacteria bacterium]